MSEPEYNPLAGAFSADWLMEQSFPPLQYVVDGIIPEGLTILVAPPKLGKSWLVLDTALRTSVGALALGCIQVHRRPVLYLALEDGPRRLQSRLSTLGAAVGSPDLHFLTSIYGNPLETIGAFLEQHSDRNPFVIVDTLGKIKGIYNGNDAYGHDYAQAAALKALVDRVPGSSMVVVHHTNKGAKDDFVDSVSGTHGIAGAADTILTLTRDRNDGQGTLNVTSRDAAEGKYALSFENGSWTLDGADLAESAQRVRDRAATDGVGKDMETLIRVVQQHPEGISPKDAAEQSGLDHGKVREYLRRAVESERLQNPKRGLYTPVTTVTSVTFSDRETSQSNKSNCGNTPTERTEQ